MTSETPQSNNGKSQWADQLALAATLNSHMLDGIANILMLNIQTTRDALGLAATGWQKLLSATGAEVQSTLLAALPVRLDSAIAYNQKLIEIADSMREKMTRDLQPGVAQFEQQFADQYKALSQQVPTGARSAFDVLHDAFDHARDGYREVIKSSERAAHTLAASLDGADPTAASATAGKRERASGATPA